MSLARSCIGGQRLALAARRSKFPTAAAAASLHTLPHPIWTKEQAATVKIEHTEPLDFVSRLALASVRGLRGGFDLVSGYTWGQSRWGRLNEGHWLMRIIFLETVAAVPGMMGAMVRHLQSLRMMKSDNGWIHTLLEEAENERMHLMTALELKNPGRAMRALVLVTQGVFTNLFFLAYLVSPYFCHKFVGYLEEEAVKTYTHCLKDLDEGKLPDWTTRPAPPTAMLYWNLPEGSTMRDVVLVLRKDEAHHRDVNHRLAELTLDPSATNPFEPGK